MNPGDDDALKVKQHRKTTSAVLVGGLALLAALVALKLILG